MHLDALGIRSDVERLIARPEGRPHCCVFRGPRVPTSARFGVAVYKHGLPGVKWPVSRVSEAVFVAEGTHTGGYNRRVSAIHRKRMSTRR
jgi:hypothetical protein